MHTGLDLIQSVVANQQSYGQFIYYLLAVLHTALKNDAVMHYVEQVRANAAGDDTSSKRETLESLLGESLEPQGNTLTVVDNVNNTSLELSSSTGSFASTGASRLYALAFVTIYDRIHKELETNTLNSGLLLDKQFLIKSDKEWSAGEEGAYPVVYSDKEIDLLYRLAQEEELLDEEINIIRKAHGTNNTKSSKKAKEDNFLKEGTMQRLKQLKLISKEEQHADFLNRLSKRVNFHDFSKRMTVEPENEMDSATLDQSITGNRWLFVLHERFEKLEEVQATWREAKRKMDKYDERLKQAKHVDESDKALYNQYLQEVNQIQKRMQTVQKEMSALLNDNLTPFFEALIRQTKTFCEMVCQFLDIRNILLGAEGSGEADKGAQMTLRGYEAEVMHTNILDAAIDQIEHPQGHPDGPQSPTSTVESATREAQTEDDLVLESLTNTDRPISFQLTEANLRELEHNLEKERQEKEVAPAAPVKMKADRTNSIQQTGSVKNDLFLLHENSSTTSKKSSGGGSWNSLKERAAIHKKINQTREIYFRFFFFDNLYNSFKNVFLRFQLVLMYLYKTVKDCNYIRYISNENYPNVKTVDEIKRLMAFLDSGANQRRKKPYEELNNYLFIFRKRLEQLRFRGKQIRIAEDKIEKYSDPKQSTEKDKSTEGEEKTTTTKKRRRLFSEKTRRRRLDKWQMELAKRENEFRSFVHLSFKNGVKEMFLLYENLLYIVANYLEYFTNALSTEAS
ncbi:hypothetical protein AGDE_16766 [Angomonas deanei]|nr:hypothetical protein AGDE_16766 [Angomonas deanei]|eukprot:EPY16247.1 hypothetical protein AGDE_16766 [Angomonas deanei]